MVTIIFFTVLVSVIFGWIENKHGFYPNLLSIAFNCFFGAVIGLVIGGFIAMSIPSETKVDTRELNLTLLNDGSSLEGSFFLGIGNVSGSMKYIYYYEEKGQYKMDVLSYKEVAIEYSDSNPKLLILRDVKTDAFINSFSICLKNKKYVFRVPEGSIKSGYNLDAQ